jgi:hypothetical protein
VIIRNSAIETSHSRKHQDRWLGPKVVVRRTEGGSYILSELSGEVSQTKYAATRVKRYHTRDGLTFPVQALLDTTQWWRAMNQRAPEVQFEPESEDDASIANYESESE